MCRHSVKRLCDIGAPPVFSSARLGGRGASLLMLRTKSRHEKPVNVRRYFKPSLEAIAELTCLLASGGIDR